MKIEFGLNITLIFIFQLHMDTKLKYISSFW